VTGTNTQATQPTGLAPDLFRVTQNVNESFISTLEEGQKTELLKILKTLSRKLDLHTQD